MTEDMWPVIRTEIFDRVLAELNSRGITYKGVLYAGLMMTDAGPRVLEFNCRFGDPETQAVIPRIDGDIVPVFEACIDGTLSDEMITWRPESCVCVVMASGGYPGSYEKGKEITGLEHVAEIDDVVVFHAGTVREGDRTLTSGGRVLGVCALGDTTEIATRHAYRSLVHISFDQVQYRTDIAARAIRRQKKP